MKLSFVRSMGMLLACATTMFVVSVSSLYSQENDAVCPFMDDEVILYHSPSTLAKIPAVQNVWGCDEAKAVLNGVLDKIDVAVADSLQKESSEAKKEQFNYFKSIISDATHQDSFSRALLGSYFKYVDAVAIALDLPENVNNPEKVLSGLSVTYVLNENPKGIDVGKFVKKEDYEVIRANDSELIVKLNVYENSEVKGHAFFGGTKVKDMNKYALVLAGTQEGVEKKIKGFQETNDFLAKRLNDSQIYVEHVYKSGVFKCIADQLAKKADDPKAKEAQKFIAKIASVSYRASGVDNGVNFSLDLEAVDAESAKMFADLSLGGLAVLKMKANNAENLSAEAKLGVEVLKQIEIVKEEDQAVVKSSTTIDVDLMKRLLKNLVWDKVKEALAK